MTDEEITETKVGKSVSRGLKSGEKEASAMKNLLIYVSSFIFWAQSQ